MQLVCCSPVADAIFHEDVIPRADWNSERDGFNLVSCPRGEDMRNVLGAQFRGYEPGGLKSHVRGSRTEPTIVGLLPSFDQIHKMNQVLLILNKFYILIITSDSRCI